MIINTPAPKISVAIATLNEGPDLEVTIAMVYASRYAPHEVIVCDDNSKEDPRERLSSWIGKSNFKYLRNDRRLGSGQTKQIAMSQATGDLIVILDSHMRPHWEWLNQIAQAHRYHPNAILCTESIGFKQHGSNNAFYGRGAWFDSKNPYKYGAHTVSWQPSINLESCAYPRITAMHGGCYIFPAYQYKTIGEYSPLLQGWGYEEEWVAMRAAMLGIETRLISGCPIQHQYERTISREPATPDRHPQGWEPIYNRHAVSIASFGWDRWRSHYRQQINENSIPQTRPIINDELERNRSELNRYRQFLKSRSMPESDWMARVGIQHPDPAQASAQAPPNEPQSIFSIEAGPNPAES